MTQRRVIPRVCATTAAVLALAAASLLSSGPASAAAGSAPAAAPNSASEGGRPAATSLSWRLTPTGTTSRFRGLAALSRSVAWAGGYDGVVLRTVDGGRSWSSVGPAAAAGLQFRDIEATSASHAIALTIGPGEDSRVYVTDDGGSSWRESFRNTDPNAFYDCLAFFDAHRGIAVSDPPDGAKARIIATADGGHSWSVVDPAGMPPALAGEFYFAASGTCLTAGQGRTAYLGTGGAGQARVLTSLDRGLTWAAATTPLTAGPSAGIFSVQFRDRHRGIVVGGDFSKPTTSGGNAAYTSDGGATWQEPSSFPAGYRSGADWMTRWHDAAIAVGPSGSDVSWDGGRSWSSFDTGTFDGVQCTPDGACWASGAEGRIGVLEVSRP